MSTTGATVMGSTMIETHERSSWTFLTNHMYVLLCIASDPSVRLRDIALQVGITERAAQSIVADLVDQRYVTRMRVGRRNHYEVNPEMAMRHPLERPHSVDELLALLRPDHHANGGSNGEHAEAERD